MHHHVSLSPVLPRSFPSKPSVSPSTSISRRAKNSQLSFAKAMTTTTRTNPVNKPNIERLNNGEVIAKKPHSKSYLLRQTAIRQVQQSTDLGSALSRFFLVYSYFCNLYHSHFILIEFFQVFLELQSEIPSGYFFNWNFMHILLCDCCLYQLNRVCLNFVQLHQGYFGPSFISCIFHSC